MNRVRTLFVLLAFLLAGTAFAQHDLGLDQETDRFTGEQSCTHSVAADSLEVVVILGNNESEPAPGLSIMQRIEDNDDRAFNMFGAMSGDQVYLRFPDGSVEVLDIAYAEGGFADEYENTIIPASIPLLQRIMSAPDDIEVRFDGSEGRVEFVIPHNVITTLAAGFGQTCL